MAGRDDGLVALFVDGMPYCADFSRSPIRASIVDYCRLAMGRPWKQDVVFLVYVAMHVVL